MSRYRIFRPINSLNNNMFTTALSSIARASHNYDNAYDVNISDKHYLVVDGNINISSKGLLIEELSIEQFIHIIAPRLVNIEYSEDGDKLKCTNLHINKLLNGFVCDDGNINIILNSDDNITSIDFYILNLARNLERIIDSYTVGSDIDKYQATLIKNLLKNNKDKMYDYIIIKLIDKQYIAKRYEVKI